MTAEIYLIVGERLREERTSLGLNQAELAEHGGVSTRSVRDYEGGKATPNAAFLAAIAAKGADVLYIVTGRRETPPASDALSADEQALLRAYSGLQERARPALLDFLSLAGRGT